MDNPSSKQLAYVKRIINKLGIENVQIHFPSYDLDNLSKDQSQKIINKLGYCTARPIYGVVGRDIPFSWRYLEK